MDADSDERRRFAEDLLARAGEEARRNGRSEADIAAAHRRVEEYLAGPSAPLTVPPVEGGRRARVDTLPDLGPGWLMWVLRHPLTWRVAVVVILGVGGYFGADVGRNHPQPFPKGPTGLAIGTALGLCVLLLAEASVRIRRRRR